MMIAVKQVFIQNTNLPETVTKQKANCYETKYVVQRGYYTAIYIYSSNHRKKH